MRPSDLSRVLLLLAGFAGAGAQAGATHEYVLDNGLKVIVREDSRAPVATVQVWYRVGSSHEPDGITGISHVLEHMMFKGTPNYGPGEYSRILSANGAEENAFTSRDYTAYYATLASDRVALAMELEADRMRHLTLAPEEFARELEVVKEERRLRTEDRPTSLTYEQLNAVSYRVSPYRNPVIGWMGDLDQMTVDDLRAWYQRWYAPNNAILVVVGDVRAQDVLALAKQHFGPLAPQPQSAPREAREPEPRGTTRVTVRAPAQQPYLMMGYKAPVLSRGVEPWEPYALEVLSSILDGGDSARFATRLVRDAQVASDVDADYSAYGRLPGMLTIDGSPAESRSVAELEAAVRVEIDRLKTEPVSAAELQRVITQLVASKVYEKDSIMSQAMRIGSMEALGLGWQLADSEVERIRAVTAEQVQAVAKKYLDDARLTVAVLEPQPMGNRGVAMAREASTHAR
jgi:zinc protease